MMENRGGIESGGVGTGMVGYVPKLINALYEPNGVQAVACDQVVCDHEQLDAAVQDESGGDMLHAQGSRRECCHRG